MLICGYVSQITAISTDQIQKFSSQLHLSHSNAVSDLSRVVRALNRCSGILWCFKMYATVAMPALIKALLCLQ